MALDRDRVVFTQPVRQIVMMLSVLVLVGAGGTVLAAQIRTVFWANPYLNGFIGGVFILGVFATFWQVTQLIAATNWLRNLQAGHKGAEQIAAPRILTAMTPMVREGELKKRLAASSTRSILDSVATRLDEARDITRYITNLLIFLGLLGTFWGLSNTVPAVVDTIRSLAPQPGDVVGAGVFERLMGGLEDQLGGMGTAFASSLLGLAGSLVVGLLELFAGHGQNRFYRELEEWLTSFTRLGLVSEGEGPDGALIALLERVDEGLERTSQFAEEAAAARVEAENRLSRAADVVAAMAGQIDREHSLVAQLVGEIRDQRDRESARESATLTALKRLEQASAATADGQSDLVRVLSELARQGGGGLDGETRMALRNMDKQLRVMTDDMALGRHESTQAIRGELRALINLIDLRTRPAGGGGV